MFVVKKSEHNPILIPDKNHYWEEFATFNICPIQRGRSVYGLYRAISAPDVLQNPHQISTIGIGASKDGLHFENRKLFLAPETNWDKFGCEDPRVTYFEGNYYIFYTALSAYPPNAESIKVAVAISKNLKNSAERHLVTPFNAKAMALFPERIGGKIAVIFSAHTDSPPAKMALAYADRMEDLWTPSFWEKWQENINDYVIDPKRSDRDHVEVGAPPIKTPYGWLLIYSHIQNYFGGDENNLRIFGVEALLLDLEDPKKIIGRTSGPLIVPEAHYELSGFVPNVVFPSGALLKGDILTIYYGAADTTGCIARVSLRDLIGSIHPAQSEQWHFRRLSPKPIITPSEEHAWEAKATFNPAAIALAGKIHLVYRALSPDKTSTLGYAATKNGVDIIERLPGPIYLPREEFESKKISNANSGCEDPRLTKIGQNIYMCYTAYDSASPPRVAVSFIAVKNFLAKKWDWSKPALVTPPSLDDKDACLFPKKFKDGYFIAHRVGNEICGDYLESLDFKGELVEKCIRVIGPRANTWDSEKVGIAAPPVKTKYGWLLLYHGVSKNHHTYRIGAALLDSKDPGLVLARSTDAILEPEEEYEKKGVVDNVVFPCGMVVKGGQLLIYYGGGDRVINVAAMDLDLILKALVRGMKY